MYSLKIYLQHPATLIFHCDFETNQWGLRQASLLEGDASRNDFGELKPFFVDFLT